MLFTTMMTMIRDDGWRRGLVSRWSSRTREAQWEEDHTANLSGAHLFFQANDPNRRDNFEK